MLIDTMQFSKHSEERMEQRGINLLDVENIVTNGDMYYAGSSCYSYYMSKKSYSRGTKYKSINKKRKSKANTINKAVLVSNEGVVITVAYYAKPEKHWQRV